MGDWPLDKIKYKERKKMADKFQVGIYKVSSDKSLEDVCEVIQNGGFESQNLISNSRNGYSLRLYYQDKDSNPRWKDFLEDVASSGQNIIQRNRGKSEGFILLIKKEESLYAVMGGHGYFAIQNSIDNEFGIDVFSRLIKKEDKVLKATREKSVVGGILGTSKHFRNNFNLFETDDFGKIYQELKASLNKSILTDKFGFTDDDIKKDSFCVAKSSFRINKAISFDQLLTIIGGCESVIETETAIPINNVDKIIKKRNTELVNNLESNLIEQLWKRYNRESDSYDFDLCNNDFERYLTASSYIIKKKHSKRNYFDEHEFESLNNIDKLFDKLRESELGNDEFVECMKTLKIYSYDEENKELTKGKLLNHILGDVTENNKKYFFINNSWYYIKQRFIEDLNKSCKSFIKNRNNYYDGIDKCWGDTIENEDDYNKQYIGEDNTIVLHKVIPQNIEACDILKWDERNIYLCHIKKGFDNMMRDLCSQISIAARRILLDINSDKSYITEIFHCLRRYKNSENDYLRSIGQQTESYNLETFKGLFDKNRVFVLAVMDTNTSQREIGNVETFRSNIAKFSLQELYKEIRGLNLELKITQIRKGTQS